MIARDMSLELYLQNVRNSIDQVDFLQGVFKAFVFAVVIGGIGCRSGLKTQVGPGAVGASTTRAVVAGIVAIIVLDGVLVGLFHALGI
jgi:phospholipid/cholesterol/gamma-HCH transport system permease protein